MDLDLNEPIEPEEEKETSRARRRRSRRKVISPLTPDEKTEFIEGVLRKTSPSFDFFLFSLLAGVIIGLGFLLDSVYILILGALFAPVMGPLVGISLGIILGSGKHFGRSLGGFLVGSFLVIVGGALAGLLTRLFPSFESTVSPQFVQLGWPAFLVLAIGAVFTTAFIVRERRHPGVASAAISLGLFLPLAAAGFGLGSGIPHLWPDGLVLFLIHLSWAALAGAVTLAIMGFKPLTLFGYSIGGAVALLAIILLLAFFGASFVFTGDLAQPTPTYTLAPTETPTLTPSPTPVPPTATLTPSLTPTATLTATPTLTPSPTPVEARVNANSGIVIREAPNGESLVVSRAANGSIIQLLGPLETDQFGREWLLVLDINTTIEGWVLSGLVITATPVVEPSDPPTSTPAP